jgi:excinuclease ABC subunit B
MKDNFKVVSKFEPAGDQPKAIEDIVKNVEKGCADQILLGVTGSGKTYTMAKAIEKLDRPALIISPNKVLAAQLYAEFKSFFPNNAVEYFISYYDYYQPEAYIPQSNTYIEKVAEINNHIEKLRLKASTSIITRRDTIVVASVSCIYNIGSPENFSDLCIDIKKGMQLNRTDFTAKLIQIQYDRNDVDFSHGKFRVRGPYVDIYSPYSQTAIRVEISQNKVASIVEFHPTTGDETKTLTQAWIYPARHFVATSNEIERAIHSIRTELPVRLSELKNQNKLIEHQRLEQRTNYDIEMLRQTGFCKGIENYSRHISGNPPGTRPDCLIDYFIARKNVFPDEKGFLVFIDESHVGVPQIRGMYEGDRSRKQTLVDFGFRLPSALDNRPLKFNEFEALTPQKIYVSATPGDYEFAKSEKTCKCKAKNHIVEQIIRPTGLVDPPISIHPTKNQIKHLSEKIRERARKKERCLVLTLTKKTAEDLSAYFAENNIRARYLHSSIETLERIEILNSLRKGDFDVLVGINLLREGLDIPEVSLVAILEADNEGFLRSETTLIQISGRAARNVGGEVVLYADYETGSIKRALSEMQRRREKQLEYNKKNKITPKTIVKATQYLEEFQNTAKTDGFGLLHKVEAEELTKSNIPRLIEITKEQMEHAAQNLEFELAASLRDRLFELKTMSLKPKSSKKRK